MTNQVQLTGFDFHGKENVVGKGENAGNKHFHTSSVSKKVFKNLFSCVCSNRLIFRKI